MSLIKTLLKEIVSTLPIKKITTVYHVGEMDIKNKSDFSLEGSGLSVSKHPDEWRTIARLGDRPLFELTNSNAKFIDAYKLKQSDKKQIIEWGVTNKYINKKETYRIYSYNDNDKPQYMEFNTREEAEAELDEDTKLRVNKNGLESTNKLNRQTKQNKIDNINIFDLLLTVYIEQTILYDGIWWNDYLDVRQYSAPRGVIFNSKLKQWKINKLKSNESN